MSPKTTFLTVGLTALGLCFGYAATCAAYSDDAQVPPASSPAPVSAKPMHSVLLLSNGKIFHGAITEGESDYVLRANGGEIRFKKDEVEGKFASLNEVYQYRRSLVPDRDPDEHLKLARWCLIQNMQAEAKAELGQVLAISPKAGEAKAMLAKIEAAESTASRRPPVDPGIVQSAAVVTEPMTRGGSNDSRPGEIDANVIRRAQRELGVSGLPIIFDLPPAIAVKRADTFSSVVHPILLGSCAKCHNENYPGRFQLIEVKRRKDITANVLRANLDMTLQLVDPDNLSKSELLASAIVPHGNSGNKKPIFRGSNDPRFQILLAWVTSLRAKRSGDEGLVQTRFGPQATGSGSGFASDRGAGASTSNQAPGGFGTGQGAPELPANVRKQQLDPPPTRYVPGRGMVIENGTPSNDEFPVSPLLGGPKPKTLGPGVPGAPKTTPGANPAGAPAGGLPTDGIDPAKAANSKPKKPFNIDAGILERALQLRNSQR